MFKSFGKLLKQSEEYWPLFSGRGFLTLGLYETVGKRTVEITYCILAGTIAVALFWVAITFDAPSWWGLGVSVILYRIRTLNLAFDSTFHLKIARYIGYLCVAVALGFVALLWGYGDKWDRFGVELLKLATSLLLIFGMLDILVSSAKIRVAKKELDP